MTRVIALAAILEALPDIDIVGEIERGFIAYSEGRVEVPPVGELLFPKAKGELHIKYGAIDDDDVAVIKIATGFYDNPSLGLPPFGGLNIVVSARTGQVEAVLLDEGHLTNLRTAAAGAVAARHLAPRAPRAIGVLGSGTQARLQADLLRRVAACRELKLWGREPVRTEACARDIAALGFRVEIMPTPAAVAGVADLIVATTASHEPLLGPDDIRPGTHITAVGSDTPEKCELDPALLAKASIVVADSISQCRVRGEVHHALAAGLIDEADLVELGTVASGAAAGRGGENDITIADLTGVAVQDIMIAKAVLARI